MQLTLELKDQRYVGSVFHKTLSGDFEFPKVDVTRYDTWCWCLRQVKMKMKLGHAKQVSIYHLIN